MEADILALESKIELSGCCFDSLASFLDSSIENLDSSIRKNKPDVAQFIGLIPPKADRVEALPVKSLAGYPLFPHQRRALRQIQQYIQKGRDRILLHMPTGGGKTRTRQCLIIYVHIIHDWQCFYSVFIVF